MADRPNQSDAQEQNQHGSEADSREARIGAEGDARFGRFGRRSYLKAGAATAIGTVGLSGQASAETRGGVSFDRVVDAVEDLGMDPNGNAAIDDQLDSAWGSGTLIEFPAGEYLVTREHNWFSDTNVGIVGKTGNRADVQFVFPSGYNDRFLNVRFGRNWLFGDFTVQQTNDTSTGVGLSFAPNDNATISNIEIAGFNPRHKQRGLNMAVYDADGTATLDRYVRKGGSAVGNYPSGTQAMLVSHEHEGVLEITNPHIENAGENGIYASRCPGEVKISNGYFANNDIASVRIAGTGSYVKDSTFVIDTENADVSGSFDNARGLWMESNSKAYLGGKVDNCDFILKSANNSGGLMLVHGTAGDVEVTNCRFQNETRWATLHARDPSGVSGSGPLTITNSSFTGGHPSPTRAAIELEGRDQSMVSDCCVQMSGGHKGVVIADASGCTVRRSTINVDSTAIASPGSNVAKSGISHSGSCPAPTDGGSGAGDNTGSSTDSSSTSSDSSSGTGSGDESTGGDSGSSSTDNTSSSSTESTGSSDGSTGGTGSGGDSTGGTGSGGSNGEWRTLTLKSSSLSSYSFEVSGELEFDPAYGTEDALSGSSATGVLAGGRDAYRFTGEVTSFDIGNGATVWLDGQQVAPSEVVGSSGGSSGDSTSGTDGSSDSGSTDGGSTGGSSGSDAGSTGGAHTLSLRASSLSAYSFTVDGSVEFDPNYGTEDRIDGNTVSGVLAGGRDRYQFTGQLTSFDVEGSPEVRLDGKRVDPSSLPSATGGSSGDGSADSSSADSDSANSSSADSKSSGGELSNTISLKSSDPAPYTLEVNGDIAFDPNYGTEDNIGDSSSSGFLAGGRDAYRFSGAITKFEVDGTVDVVVNGESVPADDVVGRGN